MANEGVTIVGAGLAGWTLAKELRKLAPDLPITLVTADSGDVYSKPMLSNALAQGKTPESLVQTPAGEQAVKLGITLYARCDVRAIQPSEKVLDTPSGPIPYDRLVLALGARPRGLDLPGGDLALSVNHLDHYAQFRHRLVPGSHVCILGAGLVGCEFANDLALVGHRVTLIETDLQPLGRRVPQALSDRLAQSLAALGVTMHCHRTVTAIECREDGHVVTLDAGDPVVADLVLAATGLQPATELAREAGLAVGRGIRVDRHLSTSDAHIHALGDCAEVDGLVLPYVLPLMQQARALAASLAGTATPLALAALPVAVKTPACPMVLCLPSGTEPGTWVAEREDAAGAQYLYQSQGGRLLGFALAGDACDQRRRLAAMAPPLLA